MIKFHTKIFLFSFLIITVLLSSHNETLYRLIQINEVDTSFSRFLTERSKNPSLKGLNNRCKENCNQNDNEELSQNNEELSQNNEELSQNNEELSQNNEELSQNNEELSQNNEEITQNKDDITQNNEEKPSKGVIIELTEKSGLIPIDNSRPTRRPGNRGPAKKKQPPKSQEQLVNESLSKYNIGEQLLNSKYQHANKIVDTLHLDQKYKDMLKEYLKLYIDGDKSRKRNKLFKKLKDKISTIPRNHGLFTICDFANP
ncbi:Hypotetical protein [Plasmodium sp. gorilla clade G2]|uniref:Hypotetical protein n=1 Tax=Plasmodium sp. gorilla clade G2 TaxID=880535 RepID=UPI000D2842D8|nr:Hypotetical protein [Plasmodium sp. gorilla clade G2]SOV20097.1 Hypotetical protein [Plasmodium sp. gorilla clade G2]